MNSPIQIQIDPHTRQRMPKRGVSQSEIVEVIQTGELFPAKLGRTGRFKVFQFDSIYEGKFYQQKRIEVIYVEENNKIVTVTVYARYGKWEE
ncbi:MAG: DUF4258 domain-containing protein [Calditrichaeota bacterium]|nr:DUF4258 domain-containing protein [Calditrichota bacterium]